MRILRKTALFIASLLALLLISNLLITLFYLFFNICVLYFEYLSSYLYSISTSNTFDILERLCSASCFASYLACEVTSTSKILLLSTPYPPAMEGPVSIAMPRNDVILPSPLESSDRVALIGAGSVATMVIGLSVTRYIGPKWIWSWTRQLKVTGAEANKRGLHQFLDLVEENKKLQEESMIYQQLYQTKDKAARILMEETRILMEEKDVADTLTVSRIDELTATHEQEITAAVEGRISQGAGFLEENRKRLEFFDSCLRKQDKIICDLKEQLDLAKQENPFTCFRGGNETASVLKTIITSNLSSIGNTPKITDLLNMISGAKAQCFFLTLITISPNFVFDAEVLMAINWDGSPAEIFTALKEYFINFDVSRLMPEQPEGSHQVDPSSMGSAAIEESHPLQATESLSNISEAVQEAVQEGLEQSTP